VASAAVFSILFSDSPGIIELRGELDGSTVGVLEAALDLTGSADDDLLLDLSGLDCVDPAGLIRLLELRRKALRRGGRVRLLYPRPSVARVLDVTGLDVVFARPKDNDVARENDFA
jgi:anti-sigma B factor antagonist